MSLAPEKRGRDRLCAVHRLHKSAGECTSSNGAGKGPKLWLSGEPMKAGGADPGVPRRLLELPPKPCLSMGETLSFSFSPFLKGLPRGLQSRTHTRDFCRLCNTRFTKSLLFSVSSAIHHSNIQKNIYESGG